MGCQKTLTLTPVSTDMPLDSAVYSSAQDAIFAVRGGILYKCDADTGAKISSGVFANNMLQFGSLVLASDGYLYAAALIDMTPPDPTTSPYAINPMLYKIDPATSTVMGSRGLRYAAGDTVTTFITNNTSGGLEVGIKKLIPHGAYLMLLCQNIPSASGTPMLFAYDLAAGTLKAKTNYSGAGWIDSDYSGTWMWQLWGHVTRRIEAYSYAGGVSFTSEAALTVTADRNYSLGYCAGDTRIYCPAYGGLVNVYDSSAAPALQETINTGRASLTGFRCRYNSYDGNMYVPGFNDNTVAVITPPNTVTIKTGFDIPFDVVFTPTKSFAVQQGATGLKEIT